MLTNITPVILTYNEAANIQRVLEKLVWAPDVVVVDSHSSDETLDLASSFSNVRIFQRSFDSHSIQWNFAVRETEIKTDWVLALDADYILTDEFVAELKKLEPPDKVSGYRAEFIYCVYGRPLRASLYPPVTVLFRRHAAAYRQDGHTQRVVVAGEVESLRSSIQHDDLKPLGSWLEAQNRYMQLESELLIASKWCDLNTTDKIRKYFPLFPFFVFFYSLILKGGFLDGWAGAYYALQRMAAEIILSLHLMRSTVLNVKGDG